MAGEIRRQGGFALVAVLWAVLLMALMVGTLTGESRLERHIARNLSDRAQAVALADAGVAHALLILTSDAPNRVWRFDGGAHALSFGGETVEVAIQDERGKVDLNFAPTPILQRLFSEAGLDPAAARDLTDRLDAARRDGQSNTGWVPLFTTVEQLSSWPGMIAAAFERLAPAATVYSQQTGVDPDTAPALSLIAAIDMRPEAVASWLSERTQKRPVDAAAGLVGQIPSLGGCAFTIRAVVHTRAGTVADREVVVRLTEDRRAPYWVLRWRDRAYPAVRA